LWGGFPAKIDLSACSLENIQIRQITSQKSAYLSIAKAMGSKNMVAITCL
jgi:hypothetical protein